jgi:hypothetical protein
MKKQTLVLLLGAFFLFSSPTFSMGFVPQDEQATTAVRPHTPMPQPRPVAKPATRVVTKMVQMPAVCPVVVPEPPIVPVVVAKPALTSLLDGFEIDWWKIANGAILIFFGGLVVTAVRRGYQGYKSVQAIANIPTKAPN